MTTMSSSGRLAGLEVFRGLAASGIVIFHLQALYVRMPDGMLRDGVNALSAAVPLFFALSAFSLLYGYANRLKSKHDLGRFYIRRACRILPLFYLLLAGQMVRELIHNHWISPANVMLNVLFLFPFFPGRHESLVWAGWSLGIEGFFYIMFPLVAILACSVRASAWALLMFWLANISAARVSDAMGLDASYRSMSMPANLVFFIAGTLAYALVRGAQQRGSDSPLPSWIRGHTGIILLASFAGLAVMKWAPPVEWQVRLPWSGILAIAILLWVLLAHAGLPRWMTHKALKKLGTISYGTYLIHPVVLWVLHDVGYFNWIGSRVDSPPWALAISAATALPLVWMLAMVSWHWIESPAIRWGERCLAKSRQNTVPEPQAVPSNP